MKYSITMVRYLVFLNYCKVGLTILLNIHFYHLINLIFFFKMLDYLISFSNFESINKIKLFMIIWFNNQINSFLVQFVKKLVWIKWNINSIDRNLLQLL